MLKTGKILCYQMLHYDMWGPYRTPSLCGAYYFLIVVDDFYRAVWIILLLTKYKFRELSKIYGIGIS